MKPLGEKAKQTLDRIAAAFDNPADLVDTIKRAALIPNDSPCAKWSYFNRILTAFAGTGDARGFRQWKDAGRSVKKGAKAFYILIPCHKTKKKENDDGEEESARVLVGFKGAPVFRVEDTEGEALPDHTPERLPKLADVAESLGVTVEYTGNDGSGAHGYFNRQSSEIKLFTHDLSVFYHELAHALHHKTGKLRDRVADPDGAKINETVAEVSAAVLVSIFEGEQCGMQALQYVQMYQAGRKDLFALIPEIMEVVGLAINYAGESAETKAA